MISVKNLHKSFGDLEVLKGIDLEVKQGEVVVVIGPSGSGKSTLIRCLNMLEVPTRGEVYIDGTMINDPKTNVDLLRQKMGVMPPFSRDFRDWGASHLFCDLRLLTLLRQKLLPFESCSIQLFLYLCKCFSSQAEKHPGNSII